MSPTGIPASPKAVAARARDAAHDEQRDAGAQGGHDARAAMELPRNWLRSQLAGTLRRADVLEHTLHAVALAHDDAPGYMQSYAGWLAGLDDDEPLDAYAQRSKDTALVAAAAVALDAGAHAAAAALRTGDPARWTRCRALPLDARPRLHPRAHRGRRHRRHAHHRDLVNGVAAPVIGSTRAQETTMQTVAIGNLKGGTGKTTIAVTLAHLWARRGARVLLVDADPQQNATEWTAPTHHGPTLADVWTGGRAVGDVAVTLPDPWRLDLVAGARALERVEHDGYAPATLLRLRHALADVADAYNVTIVDTRPSANVLTLGALRAATHLILVAEPRLHAAQGIARLRGADSQARRLDPDPPDRHDGVVANLVEGGHRRLDPRRTKELRDHYGDAVWTELPRRVAVAEAAERHPPPGDPSAPRDARRWAERLLPVADRIHP